MGPKHSTPRCFILQAANTLGVDISNEASGSLRTTPVPDLCESSIACCRHAQRSDTSLNTLMSLTGRLGDLMTPGHIRCLTEMDARPTGPCRTC